MDLSFLEAEAASAAAANASADHGSRAQRGAVAEAALEKREQDAAAKQARHALSHLYIQRNSVAAVCSTHGYCEAGCADGSLSAVGTGQGCCMLLRTWRAAPDGRVGLSRYQNALEKANYASLALKQQQEQAAAADAEAEAEDEEELQVCHGALTAL